MKIVTADKLPQQHSTDFQGLPVIIEWPKGSTRIGKNPDGSVFKTEMKADYGYIPDTTAAGDKEKLDIYVGPDADSEYAYIVEQLKDGEFDEYKIMLGFDTLEDAEKTYLEHVGEDQLGDISEVPFGYLFDTVKEKQKEAANKIEAAKKIGADKYTVIEAFLKNYKHEVDFYEEVATTVQEKLDQALQDAGIKAVVSSRAKSPERLRKKLYKRNPEKKYRTFLDIYDDIIDLAGVRVALYMPADRDRVGKIIETLFAPVREPKHFPESSNPEAGDTLGYIATHYLVTLRPETLRKKELRYADTRIEIQVASVLMHAWAEVTHDLLYKPEKGELTPEEKKTLSNLNTLVQEGERQLENLQSSLEGRTDERLRFEIAAGLANDLKARSKKQASALTLGSFQNAVEAFAERGSESVWASYVRAGKALRKARWSKSEVHDPKTREMWERAGHLGDDTHFINEAMDKLQPGRPYNTLWALPSGERQQVIDLAVKLKGEAKAKKD